jgi:hypothetical protein
MHRSQARSMGDGANWQSSSGSNGTKAEDMNLIKLLIETARPALERLIAEARRALARRVQPAGSRRKRAQTSSVPNQSVGADTAFPVCSGSSLRQHQRAAAGYPEGTGGEIGP